MKGVAIPVCPLLFEGLAKRRRLPKLASRFSRVAIIQPHPAGELFKERRDRTIRINRKGFRERLKTHVRAQQFIKEKEQGFEDAPQSAFGYGIERRKDGDSERRAGYAKAHSINVDERFAPLRVGRNLQDCVALAAD